MSKTVISVENLTKRYDLGVISTGTLSRDLNRWWARLHNQPDPYSLIGQEDKFKRLGETILALDDVSFTVQQGEALGIIGANGAGKSTLLKILSRVTAPTSGQVKIKGRIGSLLEVGTGFHPELTGRENVFLNGAILGMRKDEVERKFDEIVDFSGVEKFIDTPVKRYSSGMYVRLAFAVAAHLDPEILVVDEVLAVGDAEFQKKCLGKMGDVAGEGRTVLFVSHNMVAIQNLCKKSICLTEGRLSSYGLSEKIVLEYLSQIGTNRTFDTGRKNKNIGDQHAKIHRVRFIDSDHQTVESIKVNKSFGIEITYEVIHSSGCKPAPTLFIKTAYGVGVLHALETKRDGIFKKGNYKSIVWIPENLLNNGVFIVVAGLATFFPAMNHADLQIDFEVEDDINAITRGDYKLEMHGVIRPHLKWETKQENH